MTKLPSPRPPHHGAVRLVLDQAKSRSRRPPPGQAPGSVVCVVNVRVCKWCVGCVGGTYVYVYIVCVWIYGMHVCGVWCVGVYVGRGYMCIWGVWGGTWVYVYMGCVCVYVGRVFTCIWSVCVCAYMRVCVCMCVVCLCVCVEAGRGWGVYLQHQTHSHAQGLPHSQAERTPNAVTLPTQECEEFPRFPAGHLRSLPCSTCPNVPHPPNQQNLPDGPHTPTRESQRGTWGPSSQALRWKPAVRRTTHWVRDFTPFCGARPGQGQSEHRQGRGGTGL